MATVAIQLHGRCNQRSHTKLCTCEINGTFARQPFPKFQRHHSNVHRRLLFCGCVGLFCGFVSAGFFCRFVGRVCDCVGFYVHGTCFVSRIWRYITRLYTESGSCAGVYGSLADLWKFAGLCCRFAGLICGFKRLVCTAVVSQISKIQPTRNKKVAVRRICRSLWGFWWALLHGNYFPKFQHTTPNTSLYPVAQQIFCSQDLTSYYSL